MVIETAEQGLGSLTPTPRWDFAIRSLHLAAQHLGALRMLTLDRRPNYLEWSLEIRPEGLSTGVMPRIGEVVLDFQHGLLRYHPVDSEPTEIPLEGQTQATLLEALLTVMEVRGASLTSQSADTKTDALLAALMARRHPFTPGREDLASNALLVIDQKLSADYSRSLYRIFTAAARFRARLTGPMTPIVVWPEHFDLSFLWFATSQADDQHPHMNVGFAPFSDDISRPYLYAYAYPMPDGFERLAVPPGARWHIEGWQGMVYPYDGVVGATNPEAEIEAIYTAVYQTLAPSLLA
jgi:hypothetical protein